MLARLLSLLRRSPRQHLFGAEAAAAAPSAEKHEPPPMASRFDWSAARDRLRLEPPTPSNVKSSGSRFSTRRDASVMVDRFGECLPYADFDPDTQLFLLDSGSPGDYEGLGYVLEVSPQVGADLNLVKGLLELVSSSAAPKTGIEFTLFGSPRVDYFVDRMVSVTVDPAAPPPRTPAEQAAVLRRMIEQRAEFYRRGAVNGTHPHDNHRVRHFRAFFSVVYPTAKPKDASVIRDVLTMRSAHIATLKQYFLYSGTWGMEDLLWWYACTMNPHRTLRGDTPVLDYDPLIEPRFQCIAPDTCIDIEEDRVDFYSRPDKSDAMSAVCMSVRTYPSAIQLPVMSEVLGSMTSPSATYPCPYVVTLGVEVPDYEVVKNRTVLKAASAQRTADLEIARFSPEVKDINADWKLALAAFSEGKGTAKMYLQLVLYAPPADVKKIEEVARSVWRGANFELAVDLKMQQQALLSTLPMLNGPLLSGDLARARRSKTVTAYNVANMLPVIAEWTGCPPRDREREITPLLTFIGRRGQIMSIDPYANPNGGPHMVVVGGTGSGKSVTMNTMVTGVLATGGIVFIVDVGFSYLNTAQTLGGEYLQFDESSDICINPFEFVRDLKYDMAIIEPIIATMCSQSALGPYELSQLRIHIESVWLDAQVAHRTPSITDLAESLKNNCMLGGPNPRVGDEFDSEYQSRIAAMSHEERARYCDPRIRDLGVQLYQFTEDGPYGRFFNGRTNVQFKSNLIVLELEALKRNKRLQSVMLLIVLQLIAHEVYSGDPALKKLILLDEAWQLLKAGEASADFIEELYRRARKAGAAVCTATQSILDYDTSPAARAALANADCVFLLRQKKESIEGLVQSKKLVLNEHDLSLVRSVTKKDGYYSEAYIKIGDLPGAVGRLILDPFSLLLYSTAPVDKEAIAAYRRRGLSLADAIQSVLRDRGVTDSVALRLQSTELQEAA